MRMRKLIEKSIRRTAQGANVAADIHAAVSANVNEPGTTKTSSRHNVTIVQGAAHGSRVPADTESNKREEEDD